MIKIKNKGWHYEIYVKEKCSRELFLATLIAISHRMVYY